MFSPHPRAWRVSDKSGRYFIDEVYIFHFRPGEYDLLALGAVLLLPGGNRVLARCESLQAEISVAIRDRVVGGVQNREVPMHPRMDVAFHFDELRIRPTGIARHGPGRLR